MSATTRSAAVNNYQDSIDALPEGAFLGSLVFFSISDANVNLSNARRDLTAAGLDTSSLRKNLRPVDAFSKSTNGLKGRFSDHADGVRSELLVRPVSEDSEQVYRHLILERTEPGRNGKRKRLNYDKVGEVTFTRGTKDRKSGEYTGHRIESRRTTTALGYNLSTQEDQHLTEKLATLQDLYDHYLHFMDSHAVRTFVREYIYSLSGICVKGSGGLYFVAQEHAEVIAKLGDWVRSVGSEFHSVPLLNVGEQKAMIMQAFEDEAVEEIQRLMGEVAKILKDPSRSIEEKTFDSYATRAAELKVKIGEYRDMLGSRADRATIELDIYTKQILSLTTRIKRKTSV